MKKCGLTSASLQKIAAIAAATTMIVTSSMKRMIRL